MIKYKLINYKFIFFDEHPVTIAGTDEPMYPNCDGMVQYEYEIDNTEYPKAHSKSHIVQPFSKEHPVNAGDYGNVWKWDGNRENPTLTPSFLWYGENYIHILHLFVKEGKLDILGDSTIDHSDYERV